MLFDIMRNADWNDYSCCYVWQNSDGNLLTLDKISDKYLINILNFIAKGGGFVDYITENNIKLLCEEAKKRKLNITDNFVQKCQESAYRKRLLYDIQYDF